MTNKRVPTHPGEMLLKEFLQPDTLSEITREDFANHLGWTQVKLDGIIDLKHRLTAESAQDIADALEMEVEFWLNLQKNYDEWQAAQAGEVSNKTETILSRIGGFIKRADDRISTVVMRILYWE